MKKVLMFCPLIALVGYTIGIFFLVFTPPDIYFSPSENNIISWFSNAFSSSILLISALVLLILVIYYRSKNGK